MKKKILVVDDQPVILKYMKRLLEKNGHEVKTTTDGLSGLAILETYFPDVIFIDLIMPNVGGEKLCRVIRGMPQMSDACIAILSAIAAEEDFNFAAIGANACIAKGPFDTMSKYVLEVVDQSEYLRTKSDATKVMGLENIYKRKVTAELLAVKKHFETVLDHMSEGILELTPAGKVIMANPAATEMADVCEEKLLGIVFAELFHKVDQKAIESYIESANVERPAGLGDFTVGLNKRKISLTIMPVEGEEDWSFVVILQDITEAQQARNALQETHRKLEQRVKQRTVELVASNSKLKIEIEERIKAEAALRESEEKYRELIENINEVIYSVDEKGVINYISPVVTAIFGYETKEIMGRHFSAFFPEEEQERIAKDFKKIASGKLMTNEYRVLTQSGDIRWVRFSNRLVHKGDLLIGLSGVITDITKSKQLEVQLQQAQKMEAIGTLAGGIAHDFNNILSPIMMYSEMAMMRLPPDSPVQHNLKGIIKAGERARDMVTQILTFSRKEEGVRAEIKIIPILKEALKLLRSSIPTTIDIQQNLEVESDTVLADPTQIHQIMLNLGTNAAHAMREKGGILAVSLVQEDLDSEAAARYSDLNPGSYIKLIMSDTGHGIDDETMQRIFEPYFTTKGPGEGTGMGLALIHGIVKSYGGDITVESEPGKGTTFNVYLPRIEADVSPVEKPPVKLPKGTERILFVDDEKVAADIIKSLLESLGYNVTARTSSIEALEAFKNDPDGFDLVITDQTMPNMTGKDLANELMSIRTDIPIILCTGFSEQIDEIKAKEMGISFLMKPIVLSQIANMIREALDKK